MFKKLFIFIFFFFFFSLNVFSSLETIDFETTGGYTVIEGIFTRVITEKYEGSYSLESGNNSDNSSSCFEITNESNSISFYYKVSSESGYDYLRFYIDGVEKNKWAGELGWTKANYSIETGGNHTFKWCYQKDYSVSKGQDKVWIDLIEIEKPAVIITKPVLDFETLGGYTVSTNVVSGKDDWIRVMTEKYEGSYSLESQNRKDNMTSCFERVENISPDAVGVQFYYKVSSESGYDYLRFYIDGVEKNKWAGELGWTKAEYSITGGNHTFKWCYQKDSSVSNGQDRAWVDYFSVLEPQSENIILQEITPVSTPTNDSTPSYVFSSTSSGVITYSGSCSSSTVNAVSGNNSITFNSLSDGLYLDCKIKVGDSDFLNVSEFLVDTAKPLAIYNFPGSDDYLFPNSDFDLNISYNDTGSLVDIGSIKTIIKKWNSGSWGPDIASSYVAGGSVSGTGVIYNVSKLGFGKYQISFSISDNAGNIETIVRNMYVDEPEMNINTSELDLGNLGEDILKFSDNEIIITVKTVGAPFELGIIKNSDFTSGSGIIIDWDGSKGVGYDKTPYTGTNRNITIDKLISTQVKNLNVNGEKNVYNFPIKIGTLINYEQEAGEYEMNLGFNIKITY